MPTPLKAKDKARGHLNSGINASALTIPLQAAEGSNFPQPYSGSATSLGSSTTLNSTGIGSSGVSVGDRIHNVTDDSWATIESVSANSVTTTQLKGGTDNTWQNSDAWRVNELVLVLAELDEDGADVKYEEILVSGRSTDTLTVPAGGRGYNGTTAQSFSTDDVVDLRMSAPYLEELHKMIRNVNQQVDTNTGGIATNASDLDSVENGATHYAAASGSSNAFTATFANIPSLVAGTRMVFKANHTISSSATLNPTIGGSAQGALTIKKKDGSTNLVSGDIVSGQLVEVEYDGTNLQMLSPVAQSGTIASLDKRYLQTSADYTTTSTSFADVDGTNMTVDVVCTANTIVAILLNASISCSVANERVNFDLSVGGSRLGGTEGLLQMRFPTSGANGLQVLNMLQIVKPGSGTKTIKPQWKTGSGTATMRGDSNVSASFIVLKLEP